jgi:hypothetical protein
MKPFKSLTLLALLTASLLFLSNCAVGPFVAHETARTVGKNGNEFTAGYGQGGYVFNWATGATDRLDLGVHWESYSLGARIKYGIVSNPEAGFALAVAGGIGISVGGRHVYGDLLGSYKSGIVEPYGVFRFVQVNADPLEFKSTDTGKTSFTIPGSSFNYSQFMLGNRFWISEHWILSIEIAKLFSFQSDVSTNGAALIGGALGYRF